MTFPSGAKAFLGGALLSLLGYVLYDSVKDLAASLRLPARAQVQSRELGSFRGSRSGSPPSGG